MIMMSLERGTGAKRRESLTQERSWQEQLDELNRIYEGALESAKSSLARRSGSGFILRVDNLEDSLQMQKELCEDAKVQVRENSARVAALKELRPILERAMPVPDDLCKAVLQIIGDRRAVFAGNLDRVCLDKAVTAPHEQQLAAAELRSLWNLQQKILSLGRS